MENVIDIQEVQPQPQGALVTTIGVGGGGSNMINYLMQVNPHKSVKLIAANTDVQALYKTNADIKIKLGEKLTRGLGAGAQPEIGEKAALETYEEIKAALSGSDIVFISAGLGGGTGTGAAPVVAKAAKEIGALTVSVVTKPFKYEGGRRTKLAEEGLQNLKAESDCIVVIPNERVLSIIPKNYSRTETFNMINDVLARAVTGMSNVVLNCGEGDMNVDFADVQTVMSYRGLALMGIGEATGADAASEAMRLAIQSPLLDNISIDGAKGVHVSFEAHPDYPMNALNDAMEIVHSLVDEDANVVMGTYTRNDVSADYVKVTVIATGFEKEIVTSANDTDMSNVQNPSAQAQDKGIQELNEHFRVVSQSFKEEHGLFENELDVPAYLRAARD